ncbi:MAG: tetratricopeptide repeat protein [Bacteroidetes bacterium]|nr:tetratricopeptide repeat protein [Bacteroidota bacterium]
MATQKKKTIKPAAKPPVKIQQKQSQSNIPWLIFALLGITFIAYIPALSNQFTNWDDPGYILENDLVKSLSAANIKAIFSQYVLGNYHPITILSYAFNFNLSKLSPFGYIFTNIFIHLLNVYLVFAVTKKLFKSSNIAFITAIIFGIHPMHVESVAWIAGRKDMLYTFFYLGGIYYYLKFIESSKNIKSQTINYFLILVCFLLSLFSKAVAVTLPMVFFLIDYVLKRKFSAKLILEKVPFLILSVILGLIAIKAQKEQGAILDAPIFSYFQAIVIASYSAMFYIFRFVLPINLSAFYPYPTSIPQSLPWNYYVSFVLFIALIVLILFSIRKNRILVFGLMFFLVTVALVLQFLSVGSAVAADRYTYVPYIGLAIIIGYYFDKIQNGQIKILNPYKSTIKYFGVAIILVFAYFTFNQTKVWATSETLFTNVINNYSNVPVAYNNRGNYNSSKEKYDIAFDDYCMAIKLNKNYQNAYVNRANVYGLKGKFQESVDDYSKAIALNPKDFNAHFNRAVTYSKMGQFDKALIDCNNADAIKANFPNVIVNRADILLNLKRYDEAIENYNKYLTFNISNGYALHNIGKAYFNKGDFQKAVDYFNQAAATNLNDPGLYFNLSLGYKNLKEYSKSLENVQIAVNKGYKVDPAYLQEAEKLSKLNGKK